MTSGVEIDIELELKLYLDSKSMVQLKSTTRADCRYLKQKWNISLLKQRERIKS